MKKWQVVLLVFLILSIDQALKIYIKTNYTIYPPGNVKPVFGNWFELLYVENPGMAYGLKFGGNWGKLALTIFRLIAVIFGVYYINKIINQKYNTGFIICAALIFAGALGNLIDSCFYGLIFDKGMVYNPASGEYLLYPGVASFSTNGYGSFLHGNVVDMLHFPLINGEFPDWVPVWGGEPFEFFRPIFNIADASISIGVLILLIFQKSLLKEPETVSDQSTDTTTPFQTQ